MPLPLIRTQNKKWWVAQSEPALEPRSERGRLMKLIEERPGISTREILDTILSKRVPSRLAELEKSGRIRSEYIADLFK